MKVEIGNNNKINNSNIGKNNINKIEVKDSNEIWIQIVVGIFVTVVGGYILYLITKS